MGPEVVEEGQIGRLLDEQIREGLCVCFPVDAAVFSQTRAWHGSSPAWSVVVREGSGVVAHVGIVDRLVRAGQTVVRVAGVQNVFVLPECRGRGLCDVVMNAAMEEAGRRQFECGLLFCVPQLEKVYARCGWVTLPSERVVRVDETGCEAPLPGKNIAMVYPLELSDFPRGTIHLQGNDW